MKMTMDVIVGVINRTSTKMTMCHLQHFLTKMTTLSLKSLDRKSAEHIGIGIEQR